MYEDELEDWLAFIYNCRGQMTDMVWEKFQKFCEDRGLDHDPRFENLEPTTKY